MRLKMFVNFLKTYVNISVFCHFSNNMNCWLLPENVIVLKDKITRSESIETTIFAVAQSLEIESIFICREWESQYKYDIRENFMALVAKMAVSLSETTYSSIGMFFRS